MDCEISCGKTPSWDQIDAASGSRHRRDYDTNDLDEDLTRASTAVVGVCVWHMNREVAPNQPARIHACSGIMLAENFANQVDMYAYFYGGTRQRPCSSKDSLAANGPELLEGLGLCTRFRSELHAPARCCVSESS